MLEKFVQKLAPFIAVIIVLGIAFKIFAPRLSDHLWDLRSIVGGAGSIRKIHDYAGEYRRKKGEWPKWDNDHEFLQRFHYRNWLYSIHISGDTLWVKAEVNPESRVIKKKLWGEYIQEDNFGNKEYSHDLLKGKYLGAYLKDAKKLESK